MCGVLKVAKVQAVFYSGGLRRTGQENCTRMQDDGQPVFILPDVPLPGKTEAVQFIMAVEVGDGGTCFTMWSAVPARSGGAVVLGGVEKMNVGMMWTFDRPQAGLVSNLNDAADHYR